MSSLLVDAELLQWLDTHRETLRELQAELAATSALSESESVKSRLTRTATVLRIASRALEKVHPKHPLVLL